MIKEKMEENPAFYEKLSEKIKRIIKDYESKRITEEEFLKEALEIKSEARGENQEENLKYDERIRDNKCARAIYDNSEKYINYKEALIEFSLFVDKLFKEKSNKPDWQDIKSIRDDIMNDIDDKLDNLEDEGRIKKLENINIDNFLEVLMKIRLSAYSSNWVILEVVKNIVFVFLWDFWKKYAKFIRYFLYRKRTNNFIKILFSYFIIPTVKILPICFPSLL